MKIRFLSLALFLAAAFHLKAEACSYCPSGSSCNPKCQASCQGQGCPSGCGCTASFSERMILPPPQTLPAGSFFRCEDELEPIYNQQIKAYECPRKPTTKKSKKH